MGYCLRDEQEHGGGVFRCAHSRRIDSRAGLHGHGRPAGTFALTGGVCLANERDDSEDARSLLPDLRRETAIWRNKHVGVGEDGKSIWFPS